MSSLILNDLFWTVQGEGFHAGRRALFVRMPHCNLRCSWCDTSFDTSTRYEIDAFRTFIDRGPREGRFAVVTGGEPLMHRHTPKVVELLREAGFEVACETNGSFPLPCSFDWVTCSPKRDNDYEIHPYLLSSVHEFKYVVDAGFDFGLLDRHEPVAGLRLSLSPEFGDMADNVARILAFMEGKPWWRLSLQTHKWLGMP